MNVKRIVWTEQVSLNLLRMVAGFFLGLHGVERLFGILGGGEPVGFFTMLGLAGVLEIVGGVLLVLGLFTRPVAFLLSAGMAWVYFMSFAPFGFWPLLNGGELTALQAFLFLYLATRGGGAFSVDGIIRLRREAGPKAPVEGTQDVPELTEEDLADDPEVAQLLGDNP
ncbi:DoxX family protein [Gemmatimonadota bacterium]